MTPLETLKEDFTTMDSWEDRYAYIIGLGKGLAPYPEEHRTDTFKVKGCQSQVWLYAERSNGRVTLYADSDAIIVRGLVALLLQIYNNLTPSEILDTPRTFIEDLGLAQHLSPNRANGLAAMLKQITMYALAYKTQEAV